MNMKSFLTTYTVLSALLFAAVLIPLGPQGVQKAHAQFGAGGILVHDIESVLTNTIQTLSTQALEQKELVLDPLFYNIAKQALQQMTNDIIEWINSGFNGDPAFITDLEEYLQGISDDVAGNFIYGDQLNSVCSSFQLDVRTALAEGYQKENYGGVEKQVECSIENGEGDTKAFLNGDFNAGGWSMWFEVVLNPENTPIGAYAALDLALEEEVLNEQEEKLRQADWNQGFLSQEICKLIGGDEKCTITTPGIVFKDLLSFQLTTPARSLIEADEMNEVIGALFSNLAQQAFTGVNGLLGLGGNDSFTNSSFGVDVNLSYLDALDEESANNAASGAVAGNKIEQALRTETEVLELQVAILTQIDELNTAFEDAKEPYEDDSCWNLAFPATLASTLDDLVEDAPQTINTIVKLEDLSSRYEDANSSQEQLQILQEFTTLQTSGALSGQTAVIQYQYLQSQLADETSEFEEEIEDEVTSC